MPSKKPIYPKPELAKSPEVLELPLACASEDAAVALIEQNRWGDCPCCAHCASVSVYKMMDRQTGGRNKRFLWRCKDCKKQYTVRVGTIYQDSAVPLHYWVRAMWEATCCKNGISALELSRKLQVTYKTALYMMHRIRWGMQHPGPKLTGPVEADETWVGGKPRNIPFGGKSTEKRGQGITKRQPVLAVISRDGQVRTEVVTTISVRNIGEFIRRNVRTDAASLRTDMENCYQQVGREFVGGHHTVNHSIKEYARGDITTNRAEGFFARVKRGLMGTHHCVSVAHLPRYLTGWEFAHNTVRMTDGERVHRLMSQSIGKRLTQNMYRAQAG